MAENSWKEQQRNLSNLIDSTATERNIYITATKTRTPDEQTLSSTSFHLVFGFLHITRSDTDPTCRAQILCTCEDFHRSFDEFASSEQAKAMVASMLSDLQIGFFSFDRERGQSLLWKEVIAATDNGEDSSAVLARERVPLQDLDDVVTRISEVTRRVAREASVSGRKAVEMAITIDKRTVVPHHEFERLIPHHEVPPELPDHEDPKLYLEIDYDAFMISFIVEPMGTSRPCFNHRLEGAEYNDHDNQTELNNWNDDDDDDPTAVGEFSFSQYYHDNHHDDDDGGDDELTRSIRSSFRQLTMESLSVPAAKSEVEALKKFRYKKRSEDHEDESEPLTCVICMEEVIIGSDVTRMPCSHLYHFDCIFQWLHRDHTCPICRFNLPTQ